VTRVRPGGLFDPARTALVMIDIQNDFCHAEGVCGRAGKDLSMMPAMIDKSVELLKAARETGVHVIHVQHAVLLDGASDAPAWRYFISSLAADGKVVVEGTWGHSICEPIDVLPGEHVVPKHRSSAFYSTRLEVLLRSAAVTNVAVCGVLAEGCVESTARDAFHRDYYPLIVSDATASLGRETHEAYFKVISPRHDVVTVSALADAWRSHRLRQVAA
jgi:nicotinamidase-related amidase